MSDSRDAAWMARALRLAERGLNTTSPNPRVGCVLVAGDEVVGEGWHQCVGEAHAERVALERAGDKARGATAYVTLEPCDHQGRTGPCSEALIAAGVRRVVYAMADAAAGAGGADRLAGAGVAVEGGLLAEDARGLNPGFHRRAEGGRPWVRLKAAQSLDGRAALDNGVSQWITGTAARRDGQRWRARSCAVLTGIGTVLADDPQLNVRLPEVSRQPLRAVLDADARTPPDARIRGDGQFLLLHGREDVAEGVRLPRAADGLDLDAALAALAERGVNELLIEAGPRLNAAFLRAGLVDELILYVAPTLLGPGRPVAALPALQSLGGRLDGRVLDQRRIGRDSRIIVGFDRAAN